MAYKCRCVDGPVAGREFVDCQPSVTLDIEYEGRVLKYHLVSIMERGCFYRFHSLSEEEPEDTCERASDHSRVS